MAYLNEKYQKLQQAEERDILREKIKAIQYKQTQRDMLDPESELNNPKKKPESEFFCALVKKLYKLEDGFDDNQ
jgi:hypothetical protein